MYLLSFLRKNCMYQIWDAQGRVLLGPEGGRDLGVCGLGSGHVTRVETLGLEPEESGGPLHLPPRCFKVSWGCDSMPFSRCSFKPAGELR